MLTVNYALLVFCTAPCSNVKDGVPEADAVQNAALLARIVDPDTYFAYVTFSRPLDTSDMDDVVLDSPLYLHFGYSPVNIMNISSPLTSIWTSSSQIQFDCSRDCKSSFQPCSAVVCVAYADMYVLIWCVYAGCGFQCYVQNLPLCLKPIQIIDCMRKWCGSLYWL